MINKRFEAYKIARELKRSGQECVFLRKGLNDFGEPTDEEFEVGSLLSLYHEQNSYVQINVGDTSQYRTKKMPMLLCLYKDWQNSDISVDDCIKINNKTFRVTAITDIQEWNIICDISLEVIDNGI